MIQPEHIPQNGGIFNVSEPSDLRDSFKELNKDVTNENGFSSIDTRTRLTATQIPGLVGLDVLCTSGVYPSMFSKIGHSVKLLSVSLRGAGRTEMVDIAKGTREQEAMAGKSIIERSKE